MDVTPGESLLHKDSGQAGMTEKGDFWNLYEDSI